MAQAESKLSRKIMDRLRVENTLELSWAGGFFDGEGTAYLWQGTRPRLGIGQIDDFVLLRFRDAVGGLGNINGPYAYTKRPKATPHFLYSVNGTKALQVAELILPYVSPVKRAQLEGVIGGTS